MKPLFIHNYQKVLIEKKEEFLELFMKEGDVWEKMYMQEKYDASMVDESRLQRGYSVMKHIENQSLIKSALRNVSFRASNVSQNDPLVNQTDAALGGTNNNQHNGSVFSVKIGRTLSEANDKNNSSNKVRFQEPDDNIDIFVEENKK